jgi:hypothetical protein
LPPGVFGTEVSQASTVKWIICSEIKSKGSDYESEPDQNS